MLKADEVYLAKEEFDTINMLSKSEVINVVNAMHAGADLNEILNTKFSTAPFTHQMLLSLVFNKVVAHLNVGKSCALIDISFAPNNTNLFILHE